ncbi:MAG: hypothetical protein ACI4HQ_13410 [Acetatifactor sp.]
MRRLENGQERRLQKVVCNRCGRELKVEGGILKEGCFSAEYSFGYFSKKDGIKNCFDLCEECYDAMISQFKIPVDAVEETELLGL